MRLEEIAETLTAAFEADRVEATRHFWEELGADAFLLSAMRWAIEMISNLVELGPDRAGNAEFEVTGAAVGGRRLSIICSFKSGGGRNC